MDEADQTNGQTVNSFLPLPLPLRHHEGRRSSLARRNKLKLRLCFSEPGSGMVGALLQFQQKHLLQQSRENQGLGVSFFAEYEQINKNNTADIHLNKLRDQVRSRSEPCLSYIISRRSKPVFGGSSSRCLSPLTPRRLHPSPRHLAAQALKNVSSVNSNRRWSYASLPSHPSSGYMTQNSTPPSHSACSSSAEKIYRSDVESIEDLRKCSPLSTSFSSHQLEAEKREIEDRNIVYREKFPKVREQMESKLLEFIRDEEMVEEELIGGDAVWAFIHKQLIEIARITLKKSEENLITCQVFADNSERCELLKDEGRQKAGRVNHEVLHAMRKYLRIIARPARILEYIEFNEVGFISLLDQFEDSAREQNQYKLEPHRYILKMLGLDIPSSSLDKEACSSDDDNYKKPTIKVAQDDFERIKIISQGAYAAVYLVKHKETRQRFAMKRIAKQSLQLRNQVQRAFLERDIMTFTENPFVVSMYCSFETKNHLCMVMEYVEGGDVRTLLDNIQVMPSDMARMYTAEVVLALEYLHSYGIVHRDLKPDNLLITSLGHIKLTDFGLSKVGLMRRATEIYEERDLEESKFDDQDCVGTPEYLSPEVILQQAYSTDVDWWALGVIIYEALCGLTPFYAESVEEIFSNICKGDLDTFEGQVDEEGGEEYLEPEARSIIVSMLDLDIQNRLTKPENIKEHPYFNGIEWENILRQKAQFIPELQNDEDTSYFDPRCDRYHHGSSDDDDDCLSIKSSKSEVNIENINFGTTSHKFNNSFHKKDETPSIQSISQVPTVRPTPITTNAAKEIMNHHESRSRLIRDNSCDSITDEVFNNRHRISSASSDNDIHFNIGGDSDDEELTLTPTQQSNIHNVARRLSNSSGCESDGSSIRIDPRFCLRSSLRRVPKSASTSSIPESRLIIPNEHLSQETKSFRDSLLSSEASSRDSSPNRPSSPILSGCMGEVRQITINRTKKDYPGFTVMTIPVYIGSSNNYTLHHLVKSVSSGSEAEKAGLRETDLITHIKGEAVQGLVYTEIVTAILDKKVDLTLTVVPIDSTAISLQQCQPRKKGKLIRRHQRRNRLKGNRSSYNNLRLKSTGGIGVTPDRNRAPTQLRRSGSFPNRRTNKSGQISPRISPIPINPFDLVPCDSSSGRTSPRPIGKSSINSKVSKLPIKGRPHGRTKAATNRRKSTSHISILPGAKPLSPLAHSAHVPVSPLARTPSPGHSERLQNQGSRGASWVTVSGRSSPVMGRPVMRRRASLASCPEVEYVSKAFYECESNRNQSNLSMNLTAKTLDDESTLKASSDISSKSDK